MSTIDYYCAIAKNAQENQLEQIVREATGQPFINYHPLLNVAKKGNASYELLEFFQYKQYKDLTFKLTEKQTEQLRLLSLLELFNQKVVKYDTIKDQLKIESDIDLEYFVILLIERGWAEAKLDQASRVVKVEACKNRLYETQQELHSMAETLQKW